MGDMGAKLFDVLSANDEDISKDDNEICQICLKTTLCTDETESEETFWLGYLYACRERYQHKRLEDLGLH
jgi:hypothetical protein